MAEVVDEWPETARSARGSGSKSKYPWDEWFDGKMRKLQHGVDYELETRNMQRGILKKARQRNVRIRTAVEDDVIYLQRIEGVPTGQRGRPKKERLASALHPTPTSSGPVGKFPEDRKKELIVQGIQEMLEAEREGTVIDFPAAVLTVADDPTRSQTALDMMEAIKSGVAEVKSYMELGGADLDELVDGLDDEEMVADARATLAVVPDLPEEDAVQYVIDNAEDFADERGTTVEKIIEDADDIADELVADGLIPEGAIVTERNPDGTPAAWRVPEADPEPTLVAVDPLPELPEGWGYV